MPYPTTLPSQGAGDPLSDTKGEAGLEERYRRLQHGFRPHQMTEAQWDAHLRDTSFHAWLVLNI